MPELLTTLEAIRKKDYNDKKFHASLKGVDMGEYGTEEGNSKFEDIQLRASGIDADNDDVVSLQGEFAEQAGFGIGAGLGYSRG